MAPSWRANPPVPPPDLLKFPCYSAGDGLSTDCNPHHSLGAIRDVNPVANAGAPIVPHIPAPLLRRASSCQVRSRSSIATWSDWPCGPPCTSIIAGTDPSRGLQRRSAALPLISGAFDQRSVPEDGQAPNSTVHLMSTFDPKRTLRLTTSCSPEQQLAGKPERSRQPFSTFRD